MLHDGAILELIAWGLSPLASRAAKGQGLCIVPWSRRSGELRQQCLRHGGGQDAEDASGDESPGVGLGAPVALRYA